MNKSIFGDVNKLYKYNYKNNKYKLMSDQQIICVANKIVDNIEKVGIKQIVVSECGVYPLVYICQRIAKKRKLKIDWFFFKTPKTKDVKIKKVILYYLTDSEKKEKVALKNCKQLTREEAINKIMGELQLSDIAATNEQLTPVKVIANMGTIKNIKECDSIYEVLKGTNLYNIFNNEFIFLMNMYVQE